MPGTRSSAATKCISDVPGLEKHVVTPLFNSECTRLSAPFMVKSPDLERDPLGRVVSAVTLLYQKIISFLEDPISGSGPNLPVGPQPRRRNLQRVAVRITEIHTGTAPGPADAAFHR